MAGYKHTILHESPICFLTFDGDQYDLTTRKIRWTDQIIDETFNYDQKVILHDLDPISAAYRMGTESLVGIESYDNHSFSFGYYGTDARLGGDQYPRAYISVEGLGTQLGSAFSVEFLFRKETMYSSQPLIITPAFDILFGYVWNIYSGLVLRFPSGKIFKLSDSPLFADIVHMVFTYDGTTVCIYQDGHECASLSTLELGFGLLNPGSDVWIGGHEVISSYPQKHTSPLWIDQLSFWDRALEPLDVARHFRKCFTYSTLIKKAKPRNYWTFSDTPSVQDPTIRASWGPLNGTYQGNLLNLEREQLGPDRFVVDLGESTIDNRGYSAKFSLGAYARFRSFQEFGGAVTNYMFGELGEYAIEFWIKFTGSTTKQGVLLTAQEDDYPFDGWCLMMNTRNHEYLSGYLEFSEGLGKDEPVITSTSPLNDNSWKYILIQRKGDYVEMRINGHLDARVLVKNKKNLNKGIVQFSFMNCLPGLGYVEGYAFGLVIYNRYLQDQEIWAHYSYHTVYQVEGTVTLESTGTQALCTAFNSQTGAYLDEVWSDPNDGHFKIRLSNNDPVDIMVYNKLNANPKYRIFGPVIPFEVDDPELTG